MHHPHPTASPPYLTFLLLGAAVWLVLGLLAWWAVPGVARWVVGAVVEK